MKENEWQCFSFWLFSLFVFISKVLSKSIVVTDTVNPLEQLNHFWDDFNANVNHCQLLLITKLMSRPKEHRTNVKKFSTVIIFV